MGSKCADSKSAGGGDTWADPRNGEMHRKILYTRRSFYSQEYDESDGGDSHAAHDERGPHSSPVGQSGNADASQETQEVWRDDQLEMNKRKTVSRISFSSNRLDSPDSQSQVEQSPSRE